MFKAFALVVTLISFLSVSIFSEATTSKPVEAAKNCKSFVDKDNNGVCDHKSDSTCCKAGKDCKNFVDANKDGVCDHKGKEKSACCPVKQDKAKEKKCCPYKK
jgi:hypothetical protein